MLRENNDNRINYSKTFVYPNGSKYTTTCKDFKLGEKREGF